MFTVRPPMAGRWLARWRLIRPALTYPQFAAQVSSAPFSVEELSLIRTAYDEAVVLFAAAVRGSGRSFADHVVGTASGTLLGGGDAVDVAAALLHAAYEQGDFGDGKVGPSRRHRRHIETRVGSEVEEIVFRYHQMRWGPEMARSCLAGIERISRLDRRVLLIRVANALDDAMDGGLVVSNKQSLMEYSQETTGVIAAIAERVATPALVDCFKDEMLQDPPEIRRELILGGVRSTVVLPSSSRTKSRIRLVRVIRRLSKKVRRRLIAASFAAKK